MTMKSISEYTEANLRFAPDDALCEGTTVPQGRHSTCAGDDGQPLPAIHTFQGRNHCAFHSPFDNIYKPCQSCERPMYTVDQATYCSEDCEAASQFEDEGCNDPDCEGCIFCIFGI